MIPFTIAQVNELLQALGNIPYVYAKPLIDGVNAIAKGSGGLGGQCHYGDPGSHGYVAITY